jgi:hypothetical protein
MPASHTHQTAIAEHCRAIAKLPRRNPRSPKRCTICGQIYMSSRKHSKTDTAACRKIRYNRNQAALKAIGTPLYDPPT